MSKNCEEGSACAIDFTKESEEKIAFTINKEYVKPAIGLGLIILMYHFLKHLPP